MERFIPIPVLTDKDIIRFNAKVNVLTETECWNWTSKIDIGGYGSFWLQGETFFANRIAWFISTGVDPETKSICHTCDNPKCCNPAHLFIGTHKQNMEDRVSKGRGIKGSRVYKAKLTDEQIIEMRRLFAEGVGNPEIARRFNISYSNTAFITRDKGWKHLLQQNEQP